MPATVSLLTNKLCEELLKVPAGSNMAAGQSSMGWALVAQEQALGVECDIVPSFAPVSCAAAAASHILP